MTDVINPLHLKALAETLGEQLGLTLKTLDGYEAVYSNNHLALLDDLNICMGVLEKWKRGNEHRSVFCEMLKDEWRVSLTNRRYLRQYSGGPTLSLPAAIAEAIFKMRTDK